jgi:hypothetical protein
MFCLEFAIDISLICGPWSGTGSETLKVRRRHFVWREKAFDRLYAVAMRKILTLDIITRIVRSTSWLYLMLLPGGSTTRYGLSRKAVRRWVRMSESRTSLGSIHIFRVPHLRTEAARRFWSLSDTIFQRKADLADSYLVVICSFSPTSLFFREIHISEHKSAFT